MDHGDEPEFPPMSPAEPAELSEEQQDKQNACKQQAADAEEDGKLEVALEKLGEAISIGCASALMYSRRAGLLLKLDRPRAAINDCTAALAVNPDSAKACKIRAKAYKKLSMFEEAHADFQTALKIDYDEQTYEDSLDVEAKAKELKAAAVKKRNEDERLEEHRKNEENRKKYQEAMDARMKEQAANAPPPKDASKEEKPTEKPTPEAPKAEAPKSEGPKSHGPPEDAD